MARRDTLGGNLRMTATVNEQNRLGTGRRLIQRLPGEVEVTGGNAAIIGQNNPNVSRNERTSSGRALGR